MKLTIFLSLFIICSILAFSAGNDTARELGEHSAKIEALDGKIDDIAENARSQYSRFEVLSGVMGILITLIVILMSIYQVVNLGSVKAEAKEAQIEVRQEITNIREAAEQIYRQRDEIGDSMARFHTDLDAMTELSIEVKQSHEDISRLKSDITNLVHLFESRTREAEIIIANLRKKETYVNSSASSAPGADAIDKTPDKIREGIGDFLSSWVSHDDDAMRIVEQAQLGQISDAKKITKAAYSLYEKGMLDEARAGCEAALKINADDADLRLLLGKIHYARGDDDIAIKTLDEAAQISPDEAMIYIMLGSIYSKREQNEKAVEYFERTLSIEPNHSVALRKLGIVLIGMGKAEEAKKQLTLAVESNPESSEALFYLALSYYRLEQYEECITSFDSGLAINPKDSLAYLNRARAKTVTGDIENALNDIAQAIKLAPYYFDDIKNDPDFAQLIETQEFKDIEVQPMNGETEKSDEDEIELDL